MSALVAELVNKVDPVTLAALLFFWLRWEVWTAHHDAEHLTLKNPRQEATRG